MRTCAACRLEKPNYHYPRRRNQPGGRSTVCHSCEAGAPPTPHVAKRAAPRYRRGDPAPLPPRPAGHLTGAAIIAWRGQFGLTQEGAARALGCSKAALGLWERDQRTAPAYIALAISAWVAGLPPWGS